MDSASDPKRVVTGYPAAPPSAYAYPAPPPHAAPYYAAPHPAVPAAHYAPAPYSYNSPSRSGRLLRLLIAVCLGGFLFMLAVSFILWLVIRPRIPEFSVCSAAVSAFNLSSSTQQLSVDLDLTLSVHNPNEKMSVYYEHITAGLLYGPDIIAETSLPPFDQAKGSTTAVRARLAAVSDYVGEGVTRRISADQADGDGAVSFNVRVYGWVMFSNGTWRTRNHVMRVDCEDVSIRFKNSTAGIGSLVGPSRQCRVSL